MFSIIAAVGKNREIGQAGGLIFHLKEDMQFFKATTMGHPVVMGARTWASLPDKLPGRENIVISHHEIPGADQVVHDLDAFIAAEKDSAIEYFVIGGGTLYEKFLPYAQTLYLTEVDAAATADTFFPTFDPKLYHKTIITKGSDHDLAFTIAKYTKQ